MQSYQLNDDRFNHKNIDFQSVTHVIQYINFYEDLRNKQINLLSTSTAIGWAGLFNGLGGKENRISFKDLLPIIESDEKNQIKKGFNKPTDETIAAIKRVYLTKRLPRKVLIELATIGVMKIIDEST